MSPAFEGRSAIPLFVVVNLLGVTVLREELQHERINKTVQTVSILFLLASLANMLYLTNGLYRNREVNLINHTKLLERGRLTDLGENILIVQLYRVPDDRFTVAMPYWSGKEGINVWIRKYYRLSEEIELNYKYYDE